MKLAAGVIYHLCRLALGGVFVFAGVVKSQDVAAFAGEIANYKILPYALNYLVAATLPYVEALAGVFLIANRKVRPAALLVALLNVVFMIALASVLVRGLDIDCGCFRAGSTTTPAAAMLRDAVLLVLAGIVFGLRGARVPKG